MARNLFVILLIAGLITPLLLSAEGNMPGQSASFDRNLYFGLRNDPDVRRLQEFLKTQGCYTGPVTGNFFSLTLAGVKCFQKAHGIVTTGYFGPISRSAANKILQGDSTSLSQPGIVRVPANHEVPSTPGPSSAPTTTQESVSSIAPSSVPLPRVVSSSFVGTATASSNISGWEPEKAIDGNLGGIYSSQVSPGANTIQWLRISIQPNTIHKVRIYPRVHGTQVLGFPVDFQIQYSTDNGAAFHTVPFQSFTNYVAGTDWQDFFFVEPISGATDIRIYATRLGKDDVENYLLQLAEVVLQGPGINQYTEAVQVLDRPNAWDYAPSVVSFSDDPMKAHIFWCTTEQTNGRDSDSIYYAVYDIRSKRILREPTPVLKPSAPPAWDSYQNCDPSVISGEFNYRRQIYNFAMYYTGTDLPTTKNRIGIAFSNDLINWVKHPQPVIMPTLLDERVYGAGQQSVYSRDGRSSLMVFYTDFQNLAWRQLYYRTTSDGINFSPSKAIATAGLPSNLPSLDAGTLAYDYSTSRWYLTVGLVDDSRPCPKSPVAQNHTEIRTYVTDSIDSGTWRLIGSVTNPNNANVDHNPGFMTDIFGNITSLKTHLPTFFGHGFCGLDDIKGWSLWMVTGSF